MHEQAGADNGGGGTYGGRQKVQRVFNDEKSTYGRYRTVPSEWFLFIITARKRTHERIWILHLYGTSMQTTVIAQNAQTAVYENGSRNTEDYDLAYARIKNTARTIYETCLFAMYLRGGLFQNQGAMQEYLC